jgi:hypothetical protein
MRMPAPRGPFCRTLFSLLLRQGETTRSAGEAAREALARSADPLHDDDLQCALFVLYELHYRGVDGVDDGWEWDPELLAIRRDIEEAFEDALRMSVSPPPLPEPAGRAVAEALFRLTEDDDGPPLSRYVAKSATDDQLREFLIQRSIYQLKEADPHSWAIPRLEGVAKAALVEIEADEYGGGRPDRIHAAIFAGTMRGLGLDDAYGAYVDDVPAITLASANMMSLFGLHRRLRGAIVGHLAAFEMTSSVPNRLYGNGFRRHGYDDRVTWYFDEHVEADAVHEQIAARDLAGGLVESEPALLADVMFGAAACLAVDGRVAEHILDRWQRGESSLRSAERTAAAV